LANPADRRIDAIVGIEEDTLSPDRLADLFAGNKLPSPVEEQEQYLQRDTFQLLGPARSTQFEGNAVDFEDCARAGGHRGLEKSSTFRIVLMVEFRSGPLKDRPLSNI
jgi:hypothetical protein